MSIDCAMRAEYHICSIKSVASSASNCSAVVDLMRHDDQVHKADLTGHNR
jgi:hypothetical protein